MSYPTGPLDDNNVCKGIGAICINGVAVGMTKHDTRTVLTETADADVDIRAAQTDGDILGRRQGGTQWEFASDTVEVTLANLKAALDLSGAVAGGILSGGRRNSVATLFELTCYSEAPGQGVRVFRAHKCFFDRLPSEYLLGSAAEICTLPLKIIICRDLDKAADVCYWTITDL